MMLLDPAVARHAQRYPGGGVQVIPAATHRVVYGQFLFKSTLAYGQLGATGGVLWFLQELLAHL